MRVRGVFGIDGQQAGHKKIKKKNDNLYYPCLSSPVLAWIIESVL